MLTGEPRLFLALDSAGLGGGFTRPPMEGEGPPGFFWGPSGLFEGSSGLFGGSPGEQGGRQFVSSVDTKVFNRSRY